jgi:hypothetical protein
MMAIIDVQRLEAEAENRDERGCKEEKRGHVVVLPLITASNAC